MSSHILALMKFAAFSDALILLETEYRRQRMHR
jgi:hypothetical protein